MTIEEAIQQRQFKNDWEKVLVNLHYTSYWFADELLKVLKPHKINDQHYNILRILKGRYPDSACPGDIKEVLLNKRGDLTRLLDKLDKLSLVTRSTNPNNRRSVDIWITQKGLDLLAAIQTQVSTVQQIQQHLSQEEAALLSQLLDKMRGK